MFSLSVSPGYGRVKALVKPFLHIRLARALLETLMTKRSLSNQRFMARRMIEVEWGVSRPTVEKALEQLVDAGILERRERSVFRLAANARKRARQWIPKKATHIPALDRRIPSPAPPFCENRLELDLYRSLLLELATGAHSAGDRFLSRRRVASLWKVSGYVAGKALGRLHDEKLITRGRGKLWLVARRADVKASVLLGALSPPALPPPETWRTRRHRILGHPHGRRYRLAVVHDLPQISDSKVRLLDREMPQLDELETLHGRRHLVAFLREAKRHFCGTTFYWDANCEGHTEQLVRALTRRPFDGVALFNRRFSQPNPHLVDELKRRGIPMVTVMDRGGTATETAVSSNEVAGGYQAMRVLLENGHRDILIVGAKPQHSFIKQRTQGAALCIKESGLGNRLRIRRCDSFRKTLDAGNFGSFFRRKRDRPSALLFLPLHLFPKAGEILHAMGIHIPRDLSVIGCGDPKVSSRHYGAPDAVARDIVELATQGARQLIGLVRGETLPPITLVPMPYLVRGTVKNLPAD